MGLRDIESTLPPGFRFHPSDEELVCHYLYKKVSNDKASGATLMEVDLHTREPWELPEGTKLSANEWYFFSFRDHKYATGSRTNRATKTGYWKATGKDRIVYEPLTNAMVGMRKTLVFYGGRAPNGIKSGWVMHEFRLESPHMPPKEDWVLCRVFHKMKGGIERCGVEEQENIEMEKAACHYHDSTRRQTLSVTDHVGMREGNAIYADRNNAINCHSNCNSVINRSNALLHLNLAAVLRHKFLDFPVTSSRLPLDNSNINSPNFGGDDGPTTCTGNFDGNCNGFGDDDEYGFLLEMGLVDRAVDEQDSAINYAADDWSLL